jgi:hypothetical protein
VGHLAQNLNDYGVVLRPCMRLCKALGESMHLVVCQTNQYYSDEQYLRLVHTLSLSFSPSLSRIHSRLPHRLCDHTTVTIRMFSWHLHSMAVILAQLDTEDDKTAVH